AVQPLGQPDRGGGLALAQRGGGDGGDHHVLAVRARGQPRQRLQPHLGLERAVQLQLILVQPQLGGDGGDRAHGGGLGDRQVARQGARISHFVSQFRAAGSTYRASSARNSELGTRNS